MKHLVLAPITGLVVLLLLLLMVQLAGFGTVKPIAMQPMEAPASFDTSEIDFSTPQATSLNEIDPIALPEPVIAQAQIPEIELELDLAEPELELSLVEPLIPEVEFEDLLEPLENSLVEIPKPIQVEAKKIVAKKTPPKPKKTLKKVIKRTPTKLVKSVKTGAVAKTTSLKQSITEAEGASALSNAVNKTGAASSSGRASSKPISRVRPSYPKRARRRGIEGEVEISFLVNANGSVDKSSLKIISARPAKIFNKAVLKAVARWKFSKAARAYRNTQRLVFKLDN